MKSITERFLNYVAFDTSSDPNSETCPSTAKQFELAKFLMKECEEIGLRDVTLDEHGYLYATLPASPGRESVGAIGFLAHMDTICDCSGANIKPRIIKNYDGGVIKLNEKRSMSPKETSVLADCAGHDIIVTDGTTLLGADDKAGIAAMISAAEYLIAHPEIKHGVIKFAFTPDEEIGRGADKFDVSGFGAEFAYTIDGGHLGDIEFETFSAASAKLTINGLSVHPGMAKNVMVNSVLLANEFINMLPAFETPATTEGREGFYHVNNLNGSCEKTELIMLIRDHDKEKFNKRKDYILDVVTYLNNKYGEGRFVLNLIDSYYNMREVLEGKPEIVELAKAAMLELGIEPKTVPVRGGTDGSRLSFIGLPCPNIFGGGGNFHGPYEFCDIQAMELSSRLIAKIAEMHAKTK